MMTGYEHRNTFHWINNTVTKSYSETNRLSTNSKEIGTLQFHDFKHPSNMESQWPATWCGSFSIEKLSKSSICGCLDRCLRTVEQLNNQILLRVSSQDISIHRLTSSYAVNSQASTPKCVITHTLQNVTCVVGREETLQVAYVTSQPIFTSGVTTGNRRFCHVFRTKTQEDVKVIEKCLSEKFQQGFTKWNRFVPASNTQSRVKFRDIINAKHDKPRVEFPRANSTCETCHTPFVRNNECRNTNSLNLPVNEASAHSEEENSENTIPNLNCKKFNTVNLRNRHSSTTLEISTATIQQRLLSRNRGQTNSRCNLLLQRIVGSATSLLGSAKIQSRKTIRNNERTPRLQTLTSPDKKLKAHRRTASHLFLHPNSDSSKENQLQSEEECVTPKRRKFSMLKACTLANTRRRSFSKSNASRLVSFSIQKDNVIGASSSSGESNIQVKEEESTNIKQLHYNEYLQEWIFVIDDRILCFLSKLRYFLNEPIEKYELAMRLSNLPDGAFLVHLSDDGTNHFLILSIRINKQVNDDNIEKTGTHDNVQSVHTVATNTGDKVDISQHIIIYNQSGYLFQKSKQHFPSLPMLITHHTVIKEGLPCRLIFT